MTLRSLVKPLPALRSFDVGEAAYNLFQEIAECPLLVVVDDHGKPIGMVERNSFLMQFSAEFGRALFARRPITRIMEPVSLLVEAREKAADFAERALDNNFNDLVRGFVVVEDGHYLGVAGVVDLLRATLSERARTAQRLEKLAHFDALTGLPNRVQLLNHLFTRLQQIDQADEPQEVALLAIDLDRFKIVNDTFGHAAGDMVLKEMAVRLRNALRADDMPARLGGDEFAVVVSGTAVEKLSEKIADRLIAAMREPFRFGDKVVHLGGSIGIAIYPQDCGNAEEFLNYADVALYNAKSDGKGIWRKFSPRMRDGLVQRNAIETDLRGALRRGEIEAHLQPQLNLADGRISGFECLMRWRHPERGMISPAMFIPLAEDIGLIHELGEWMIDEACAIGSALPAPLTVAVNISVVQFRVEGLVQVVQQALERYGLDPARLELEITESVLIDDEERIKRYIRDLKALGVKISLDDFGTGFASFSYLHSFDFDKIKIDRSFVSGLPDNQASRAIVSAVVVLSTQLGAVVVAEGVETQTQLEALRHYGCHGAQGFLIGAADADPFVYLGEEAAVYMAA
ncbi:putative bifunctional diguanylate cyclase/phosphodiesterase [Novosphingobium rosa]|uniref:putative bifunctional diguanylate cyclase/phosphodiesterase n=1 Tax=Novosphingobium rosa TaxID=76978 RepID=UPI00082FACCD|nr:EAL domain-containing protein [Novosphingobium rosa]